MPQDPHERMILAAVELLASGGREAVSTRAVCAKAKVQAPTIYRHFSDMQALLNAAAGRCFEDYLLRKKAQPTSADPVEDLRRGWDLHVEFGLSNPAVYGLLYGDLQIAARLQDACEAHALLSSLFARIAESGRLKVGVERAAQMVRAATVGTVLTLISLPADKRDNGLSHAMRQAVFSLILADDDETARGGKDDLPARHAVALKAVLGRSEALTPSEATLLGEWLDRLSYGLDDHHGLPASQPTPTPPRRD